MEAMSECPRCRRWFTDDQLDPVCPECRMKDPPTADQAPQGRKEQQ